MKKNIPNLITCVNLISGCVGIYFAHNNKLIEAFYAILVAATFDFLDGLIARALHTHSEMGKQLDSLSDVISFGVLPGAIMQQLLSISGAKELFEELAFVAYLIPVFSAWRLAKFNLDTRQTDMFIGLPTPANALLIASLYPSVQNNYWISSYLMQLPVLLSITIGTSLLLVSEIPMLALKFKNIEWKENQYKFIFLSLAAIMILFLGPFGIIFSISAYILLSIVFYIHGFTNVS
ncbi:MAG: CDP-diacylglycerol--serine O-phosphatidyltransferase [Cytophagales bacterium]|nr:CDP-diacylglycerol--serine O-phosphatidyltransferase [Cytophagales bacterium]MDW8385231.1 CDP-diacylglycerol--serine O-phosphatidyltransferase [Flammeovirgaceae bacterium]